MCFQTFHSYHYQLQTTLFFAYLWSSFVQPLSFTPGIRAPSAAMMVLFGREGMQIRNQGAEPGTVASGRNKRPGCVCGLAESPLLERVNQLSPAPRCPEPLKCVAYTRARTQREYSSKELKHSIVKRILLLKR